MSQANAAEVLGLTRRGQLAAITPAFALYALLGEARAADLVLGVSATRWIERQDEIARALAAGQMTPQAWAGEVERLARAVDLGELALRIRKSEILSAGTPFGNDPQKRNVHFLDETGAPRRLRYGAALFAFQPRNVITPHGHRHMASAHLVLEGRVRIRTFDRLADAPGAMVLKPTGDVVAGPGEASAMCSQRNNVHWFTPQGGPPRPST